MVKNAITVFARLKPEKSRRRIANYKIHRRPKKHSNEDFFVLTAPSKSSEYIDNRPETWNFSFHKIFSHDVRQDDIFANVARPVIDSVFDGYNATIFAYGQTGSGKTYTMTGEPGVYVERGIIPRTLQYIFEIIRKNPENVYSVEIAYLEIYNENGYDLLLERKQREATTRLEDLPRVAIQEDENGKMHLKNLSFRIVDNENEAMKYLSDGENYRATSETPMNPRSSRSHCIFTIVISVKKYGSDRYTSAKMHLVDLAGSERVYKCAIEGATLVEAKHINLSLHFLEQVIVCLGQENVSHVPYRNSLLTSILRDSLGGNCLTTMLANLSVSNFNLEETISTCRFAQRVALVKNDVNLTFELDTKSENKLLKMENEKLRMQIEQLKKLNIPEISVTNSAAGNLEYYKNLVIQRDREIWCIPPSVIDEGEKMPIVKNFILDESEARLIDILKKETARSEKKVDEGQEILKSREEKCTQIPSSRISPTKAAPFSPASRPKNRKKCRNSLNIKSQTSGRKNDCSSPESGRKIHRQRRSSKPEIFSIPDLALDENFESQADKTSGPEGDLSTRKIDDGVKVVDSKIESGKKMESHEDRKEPTIEGKVEEKVDEKLSVESPRGKPGKPSPREKNSSFSQSVMKIIRTCNRQSLDHDEGSRSTLKSETPRSGFRTPSIFRNILCIEKTSPRDSPSHRTTNETSARTRKDREDDKSPENLKKLPLTGDPEIDEEIIAFYRAKRVGGTY